MEREIEGERERLVQARQRKHCIGGSTSRERDRERLVQARQSKHCIGGSTSRERERCVCVFFLNFVSLFFYSGNSSTYFKVLCRSLQKKKKKNLIVRDVLEYNLGPILAGIRSRQSERKRGRTK